MKDYKTPALVLIEAIDGDYYEAKSAGVDALLSMQQLQILLTNLIDSRDLLKTNKNHPEHEKIEVLSNVITMIQDHVIDRKPFPGFQLSSEDTIAISSSSFDMYGCPNCGCAHAHQTKYCTEDTHIKRCVECDLEYFVLEDGLRKSTLGYHNDSGGEELPLFIYPGLAVHPRHGIPKHYLPERA